jgi:cytochrome c-type biogenesis protein CcmE
MKARQQRFALIVIGLAILGLAAYLILNALGGNLSYFFSPTEVAEGKAPKDHVFRLGGMVAEGSVQRAEGDLTVTFVVTDHNKTRKVAYTGILPDLFDEGQGVIAQGKLGPDGTFIADEVLAKHDENYMPPEVAAAMSAGEMAKMKGAAQ